MAGQALYRKWRSQTFEEVIGQEHVALTLRNAIREGRLSHAYLFTGPRGTGKTSTARILAKAINCQDPDTAARPCNKCPICVGITEGRQLDLIEIDAASNRGIDEIRDLREKLGFRPNEARYRVYIIDEVHMLTKEAFNALLKTLEEPPAHAVFVLATTEPDRVPETVRSRCQRFDFRRVPTPKIAAHLSGILAAEGSQATAEALLAIARRSTGSMRDAISLLDQLLSYGDEVLNLARVEDVLGLVDTGTIGRLVDCMSAHDAAHGLLLINQLVANGVDLGELVDQILAYLRMVLFVQVVRSAESLELPEEAAAAVVRQAGELTTGAILGAVKEYSEARAALRDQVPGVPQLPVEMAFVRTTLGGQEKAAHAPVVREQPAEPVRAQGAASGRARSIAEPAAPPSVAVEKTPADRGPADKTPAGAAGPGEVRRDAASASADLLGLAQAQQWAQVVELARQRGGQFGRLLKAELQAVREIDVSEGMLVLRFDHDMIRERVDSIEHKAVVESVVAEIVGRPVRVRCTLMKDKSALAANPSARTAPATPAPPAVSTPATANDEMDDEKLLGDVRKRGAVIKRVD